MTTKSGAVDTTEEGGVIAEIEEIRPQVVDIETFLEIKGNIIEKEEPLTGIG